MQSGSDLDRTTIDALYARMQSLEQQNALLRDLIAISSRLSAMALGGADLATLTAQFSRLVGRDVYVLDPVLTIRAATIIAAGESPASRRPWPGPDDQFARVLSTVSEERRPLRIPPLAESGLNGPAVIAPVAVADEILGYLVSVNPGDASDADLDLLTVENAATVFALALTRQHLAAELGNRFREDLLEALLTGKVSGAEQAREWARLLGYEVGLGYRVLVVVLGRGPGAGAGWADDGRAESGHGRHLLHALLEGATSLEPRAIGVVRSSDLVILAPDVAVGPRTFSPTTLARELTRHAGRRSPVVAVAVGVGGAYSDPADLPRSLMQARQALQIGRLLKYESAVVDFEELGVYRLLFQTAQSDDLRAFAGRILGALLEYDRRHQAELVHTLRAFFVHNGSLQAAARDLVVHVNTVAYRMQRVEQISGLDLNHADDRLAAQLALKILDGLDP